MLQALSTLTLMLMLAKGAGNAPAKGDVWERRFIGTTKPRERHAQDKARSDRYTARPTSYAQSAKSDVFPKLFGRRYNIIKSDGTKRPTTRRYPKAKEDSWTKYFGKYFTRRPTQRYNAAARSDFRYLRPTPRPTVRRYGVQGDVKRTQRPTKPYARFQKVAADENAEPVAKQGAAQQEMVPEPELHDKNYFYVKSRLQWNDAQEACARRGAQLATIHSVDEHERVANACQGECWLGAQRDDVTNSFKWTDESAMDFDKWAADNKKSGLCAKMSGKMWVIADCDEKLGSVCQKLQWKARVKASVKDNYLTLPKTFARANVVSLVLLITVVVVVAFLAANYVCVVLNDNKQADDTKAASNETTPLLA